MRRRSSYGASSRASWPSTITSPDVGSMSRLIILSVVVLPQPEPPSRTSISPAATVRSSLSTATKEPYCCVSWRSSIIVNRGEDYSLRARAAIAASSSVVAALDARRRRHRRRTCYFAEMRAGMIAISSIATLAATCAASPAAAQRADTSAVAGSSAEAPREQRPAGAVATSSAGDRIGYELLGSVAALVGTSIAALALAAPVLLTCDDEFCPVYAGLLAVAADGVGLLFTLPAAVTFAGDASGGNGGYWASFVGHLIGAAVGWGAFAASFDLLAKEPAGLVGLMLGAAALQLAGGIVGYEISSDDGPGASP